MGELFIVLGIPVILLIVFVISERNNSRKFNKLKQKIVVLEEEIGELKQHIIVRLPPNGEKEDPQKEKTNDAAAKPDLLQESPSTTKTPEEEQLPADFKFTDDFKRAFDVMENTNYSVFITGKAGTGKSTLIRYFKLNTGKKAVYLAPTGVAALNIRGKTIHSLFKFPPRLVTSDQIKDNTYKREVQELFEKADIIIVDEISMARADIIEGMDYVLKKFRDNGKPFGGVQMAFIGDMYQLPPVINRRETIDITHNGRTIFTGTFHDYFQRKYNGHYFFNSIAFKNADFKYCVLNTIFRQKDDDHFIDILNAIREKNITDDLLEQLNSRYFKGLEDTGKKEIMLCTTNDMADSINRKEMNKLKTREFRYEASVTGIFESEIRDKDYPVERILRLKQNAQIMMVKNDKDGRWVNGSIGTIKKLANNRIDVEIHGTTFNINREIWEAVDYKYDDANDTLNTNVIGTYSQYPLRLAWAITIHKSQGKTFERVVIDLGKGAFAHGQTYVALSRCKTLNGIRLKKQIERKDIILDDMVVDFINEMNGKTAGSP
jgi:DNA replication protein DnaC